MVHLHVHSTYSMIHGAADPDALVRRAKELGMTALALTDTGNLFGAHRFVRLCNDAGIRPILGCELTIASSGSGEDDGDSLVLLAKNADGFRRLIHLVSLAHSDGERLRPTIGFDTLLEDKANLICLSGGCEGRLPRLLAKGDTDAARSAADRLRTAFGDDFFIELTPSLSEADDPAGENDRLLQALTALAKEMKIPVVATNDVRCVSKDELAAYALLHSDRTNRTPEDELFVCRQSQPWLKSEADMQKTLPDVPEALSMTEIIAGRIETYALTQPVRLPAPSIPDDFEPEPADEALLRKEFTYFGRLGGTEAVRRLKRESDWLAKTVWERAEALWSGEARTDSGAAPDGDAERQGSALRDSIRSRLADELETMKQLGCSGYVLLVSEVAALAREAGALLGPGRGPALGSAVCYVLGITRIDPFRFQLTFAPFLNPDISDTTPLPVLPDMPLTVNPAARQPLLMALEERFGADSLCAAADLHRIPVERALRMASQVLGTDPAVVKELTEKGPAICDSTDAARLWRLAQPLSNIFCSAGEHSSRLAVSDGPLADTVPVLPSGYGGFVTAQFDTEGLSAAGLFTFDVVSMPLLGLLKDTQDFIESARGETVDICSLPTDDKATFALFASGSTEDLPLYDSDFMRYVLGMLRPDTFGELMILAALVRPASQEACGQYLSCRMTGDVRKNSHLLPDAAFRDTLGVPVFREQLTEALRLLTAVTASEAETLACGLVSASPDAARRRCRQAGLSDALIDELTAGLRSALPKPRALTYALLGYALAYVKAHYPTEYTNARLFA